MKNSSERSYWEFAMIAGLLANAIARPLVMVLDQAFAILGLVFTLIPLVMVALVWSRNRWLILLVTLLSIGSILGALSEPLVFARLANPDAFGYFVVAVLELGGLALTTVAGFGAVIQSFLAKSTFTRPRRPLGRRIQARVIGMLNIPMRVILGLPFPTPLSGRLMLISYTGRKTGKAYQQPVSYVQQGDTLLTPGGGNWKWNLRDGQPVWIRLRGRDVLARPELIGDPGEIERFLALMTAENPSVSAFVGIPKAPDGRLDRGRLETAVSYGFRIVRWHLGEDVAV